MKLVIAGGTGFIGRALVARLTACGETCTLLTRRELPDRHPLHYVQWDAQHGGTWHTPLDGADAVINLVGESVAMHRWTAAQKLKMLRSRIDATTALVEAFGETRRHPSVLINASAIGYYGDRGDETLSETAPPGRDFLAHVAVAWETAATRVVTHGARLVLLRTGLVLGHSGGALARMVPVFRRGLGGRIGSGHQWMSWIHLDDVVGLILFLLQHPAASGPFNLVSPTPCRNREFATILGKQLHRSTRVPVPAWLLRMAMGERASLLLQSQRVLPTRVQQLGYRFRYSTCEAALQAALAPNADLSQ
ncbi:MAG: TIGR01777 family protein [Deltaproteobacteria bacterium]|nr:TIGR01777 family protein [Deltaproteobacteria bacterium]